MVTCYVGHFSRLWGYHNRPWTLILYYARLQSAGSYIYQQKTCIHRPIKPQQLPRCLCYCSLRIPVNLGHVQTVSSSPNANETVEELWERRLCHSHKTSKIRLGLIFPMKTCHKKTQRKCKESSNCCYDVENILSVSSPVKLVVMYFI